MSLSWQLKINQAKCIASVTYHVVDLDKVVNVEEVDPPVLPAVRGCLQGRRPQRPPSQVSLQTSERHHHDHVQWRQTVTER